MARMCIFDALAVLDMSWPPDRCPSSRTVCEAFVSYAENLLNPETCAVCSTTQARDLCDGFTISNFIALFGGRLETNSLYPDFCPRPAWPMSKYALDPAGIRLQSQETSLRILVCNDCRSALEGGSTPANANITSCNWIGHVPIELSELSEAEVFLLQLQYCYQRIVRLNSSNNFQQHYAHSGHLIFNPHNPSNWVQILPPPVGHFKDNFAIVFRKGIQRSNLLSQKIFRVRRQKVLTALLWLKEHNPLYSNTTISLETLTEYPEDADIEIEAIDIVDDGPTPDDPDVVQHSRGLIESIEDVGGNIVDKLASVQALQSAQPYIEIVRSNNTTDWISNWYTTLMASFPHLFPWGPRSPPVSLNRCEATLRHLLKHRDSRFRDSLPFIFTAYDILSKVKLFKGSSSLISYTGFKRLQVASRSGALKSVELLSEKLKSSSRVRRCELSDDERSALSVVDEIRVAGQEVPFSPGRLLRHRADMMAAMTMFGLPAFFITFAPPDSAHPFIMQSIRRTNVNLDVLSSSAFSRRDFLATHPAISTCFYTAMIRAYLKTVLGVNPESMKQEGEGLFGRIAHVAGVTESQMGGVLHTHMVVWLDDIVDFTTLRANMQSSKEFSEQVIAYLDTIISVSLSNNEPDSNCWRPEDPIETNISDELIKRIICAIASRVQTHSKCSRSCYKYCKPDKPQICRHFPEELAVCLRSTFDASKTTFLPARKAGLEQKTSGYNPATTYVTRGNNDIQFIYLNNDANGSIYYITSYMTKNAMPTYLLLEMIQSTYLTTDEAALQDDDRLRKKFINSVISKMASRLEVSAPMALMVLIDDWSVYSMHKTITKGGSHILHMIAENRALPPVPFHSSTQGFVPLSSLMVGETEHVHLATDYMQRPSRFREMSLYQFVSEVEKVPIGVGIRFLQSHPQYDKKGLKLRDAPVIPKFTGLDAEFHEFDGSPEGERYALRALLLYNPWRRIEMLSLYLRSWSEAAKFVFPTLSSNRYFKHDWERFQSRKGADNPHAKTQEPVGIESEEHVAELETNIGDDEEEELDNINDLEEDGPKSLIVSAGLESGIFNVSFEMPLIQPSAPQIPNISMLRSHIESSKKSIHHRETSTSMHQTCLTDGFATLADDASTNLRQVCDIRDHLLTTIPLGLEQKAVIDKLIPVVARTCTQPLRHLVSGPAGTGKSQIIKFASALFERSGQPHRMKKLAFTGSAATIINGQTIDSVLPPAQLSNAPRFKGPKNLQQLWEDVDMVIIDEISMIGVKRFYQIDNGLRQALGNKDDFFGGASVLLFGDHAQLQPLGEAPVYRTKTLSKHYGSAFAAGSISSQLDLLGFSSYRAITECTLLSTIYRQNRDEVQFCGLLNRLRFGTCTKGDYEMLRGRIKLHEDLSAWQDAPLITPLKAIRDEWNSFATNQRGYTTYYSVDRAKTANTALMNSLQRQSAGKCSEDHVGMLQIGPGCKVMLTRNIATPLGMVNGARGTVISILSKDHPSKTGEYQALGCVVQLDRCSNAPDFPGLAHNQIWVEALTESTKVKINKKQYSVRRTQLPIIPAYAMTDYKSQGQSMDKAILDIRNCRSTASAYVMLSRVKSLAGILFMEEFPIDRIQKHMPEETRNEFKRLEKINILRNNAYLDNPSLHKRRNTEENDETLTKRSRLSTSDT